MDIVNNQSSQVALLLEHVRKLSQLIEWSIANSFPTMQNRTRAFTSPLSRYSPGSPKTHLLCAQLSFVTFSGPVSLGLDLGKLLTYLYMYAMTARSLFKKLKPVSLMARCRPVASAVIGCGELPG